MVAREAGGIEVLRPAPKRALKPPFHLWMALARATPCLPDDDAQCWLGDVEPA
jgi:hypothetical protein